VKAKLIGFGGLAGDEMVEDGPGGVVLFLLVEGNPTPDQFVRLLESGQSDAEIVLKGLPEPHQEKQPQDEAETEAENPPQQPAEQEQANGGSEDW